MSGLGATTGITFDANGVPRIRDTGIAVWQIMHLVETHTPQLLLDTFPALETDDLINITRYRIDELSQFVRKLAHDGISQLNAINGYAELAQHGMIEAAEARDLLANPLRSSAQTVLAFFIHAGRVLNGTTDVVTDGLSTQFPMRVRGFVSELVQEVQTMPSLEVRVEGEESIPENARIMSDDGLQTALVELFRLRYFSRRLQDDCLIRVVSGDDSIETLICERTIKGDDKPNYLIDWSLSPVPVAAYILEQRGGALTSEINGSVIRFTVKLPLEAPPTGGV